MSGHDSESYPDTLFAISNPNHRPITVEMLLDEKALLMQVDTGASVSIISQDTYASLWNTPPPFLKAEICLRTYTGEELPVLGTVKVTAKYEDQQYSQVLYVVKGIDPPLLGS